jgi:hypothetical protein
MKTIFVPIFAGRYQKKLTCQKMTGKMNFIKSGCSSASSCLDYTRISVGKDFFALLSR